MATVEGCSSPKVEGITLCIIEGSGILIGGEKR